MSKHEELELRDKFSSITVYCGASHGTKAEYMDIAKTTGEILAQKGIRLIYGAGERGLMGQVSNSVLDNGGEVTGIIPDFMIELEWSNKRVNDIRIVKTMSERKQLLLELGDAIMVLPGGIGTMEEFFEALSWSQLLIHEKPIGLLNVEGYYDPLLDLIDKLIEDGFVGKRTLDLLIVDTDPEALLEKMLNWNHHDEIKEIY